MKKELLIGIITAIIANTIGIILYIFAFSDEGVEATIRQSLNDGFFGKIVTLGAILNLIAFFFFIRKEKDHRARGVLLTTIIIAVSVMIRKFI